jgi:hypothetical protein
MPVSILDYCADTKVVRAIYHCGSGAIMRSTRPEVIDATKDQHGSLRGLRSHTSYLDSDVVSCIHIAFWMYSITQLRIGWAEKSEVGQ